MKHFPTREELKNAGLTLHRLNLADGVQALGPDTSIRILNKRVKGNLPEHLRSVYSNRVDLSLGPIALLDFIRVTPHKELPSIFPLGVVLSLEFFLDYKNVAFGLKGLGVEDGDTITAHAGSQDVALGKDADIYSSSGTYGTRPASELVGELAVPDFIKPASGYIVTITQDGLNSGLLHRSETAVSLV